MTDGQEEKKPLGRITRIRQSAARPYVLAAMWAGYVRGEGGQREKLVVMEALGLVWNRDVGGDGGRRGIANWRCRPR